MLVRICRACLRPLGCWKDGKNYQCRKDGDHCLEANCFCPITRNNGVMYGYCANCKLEAEQLSDNCKEAV